MFRKSSKGVDFRYQPKMKKISRTVLLFWYQSASTGIKCEGDWMHDRRSNALRSTGSGGIFQELRQETDYRDEGGSIVFQAPFDESDYSERTLRLREVIRLPLEASRALYHYFDTYQDVWNRLVHLDRSGTLIKANTGDPSERKIRRDYVNRRSQSTHPLRLKKQSRVGCTPSPCCTTNWEQDCIALILVQPPRMPNRHRQKYCYSGNANS